jgi:release factor glutamine methyltransferase
MKTSKKIKEITELLKACGIGSAEKEAELIVRNGLGLDAVELYRDDPILAGEELRIVSEILDRRARREPLQYIFGSEEFLGLKILVGEGVLIPRPETELMAEEAIKSVHGSQLRILDLCTGSGCLALALAKKFESSSVYGVDISGEAIEYARKNAGINGIPNVRFFEGDLFSPLDDSLRYDLIISNPPYVRSDDIAGLQPEVSKWEPRNALDGGPEGLDFYQKIIPGARGFLNDNGRLIFELGLGCADGVVDLLKDQGFADIEIIKDFAGIERIAQAVWRR